MVLKVRPSESKMALSTPVSGLSLPWLVLLLLEIPGECRTQTRPTRAHASSSAFLLLEQREMPGALKGGINPCVVYIPEETFLTPACDHLMLWSVRTGNSV